MTLRVYDTLRSGKFEFIPVSKNRVGMYFCGMTVQDKPHMGHMLAFVAGDMIRRYLEYKGYEVTYVQNFTDIDDKILEKAREEGCDYKEVARRNIEAYFKSSTALNLREATYYPKATEHIKEIIELINKLEEKGHAYSAGGDVYFRVRTFPGYGRLSKRKLEDLMSGARVAVGEAKEDPLDFALWKASKKPDPGWDSPWGRGRPGWHIECSAMSMKYLGETLDFHGGGEDLIFPHHENELSQSEGATGKEFVRFWLHNGLLNLKGEKMSKSTGHFFAMEDVLREYEGEVVRFYLLSNHFRSQSEFSRERLEEAKSGFERLKVACISASGSLKKLEGKVGMGGSEGETLKEAVSRARDDFLQAMDDDFNSAGAIGCMFDLVRTYNKLSETDEKELSKDREALEAFKNVIVEFDRVLGLFSSGFPGEAEEIPQEVALVVSKREAARKAREFQRADELRKKIEIMGYLVEDTPEGPRVRKK